MKARPAQRQAHREARRGQGDRQEEIDSRRNELLQAQAAFEAAKADYDDAKLNLDFTQVRAPISGRISRKLVTEGNLIRGSTPAIHAAHEHRLARPDLLLLRGR